MSSEFRFQCGCSMTGDATLVRCSTHAPGGAPDDDEIVAALEALGLLKQPRPTYTCENCGKQAKGRPVIGPAAGEWVSPDGWDSEEARWPLSNPGLLRWNYGRFWFCSRRCRGEWLIRTADTHLRP
ncbi:hypothetical protein [Symbiobacterium terraclitae]|uniref:hypothetical protein n=1 Tax=Symbiobacterium terraclitae TaxID=557451 RepID=UPI0035B55F13